MIQDRVKVLRARLAEIWAEPDAFLLDAGTSAELMIARVRLALTAVLLAVPAINLIIARPEE